MRSFAPPGTRPRYAPDRPAVVRHMRLDVELDLAAKRIAGTSTLSLEIRREGLRAITIDAVEMEIEGVALDGKAVGAYDYDGDKLRVPLAQAPARGARLTVAVRYRCAPRRGLYFVGPDATNPDRPLHAWSQGQDEDARHFFPCVDAPIEKATSEVVCTAPFGNFVLSNGDLVERKVLGDQDHPTGQGTPGGSGRVRWHYKLDFPHSSYLVTLVCGPFAEVKDRALATGVDVLYYVPPGREAEARLSYGKTPAMIDFFSERIGVRYPHKRYSQIVVGDFIFGGMENTSATTLTDLALLDKRAALDYDVEPLVSHELAHQWWGDLLTCRDWSEAWLNESFATYFEYLWREHDKGRDEADVDLLADLDAYLNEAGEYQRPIVCRQYEEPIDLFDRHLYEKGGRVLHMLRHDLGDDIFWRTLRLYAERHAHGSVETRDLARAVEEVSGRNFDGFFEQWTAHPGHPDLECGWEWDDDRGVGTLRVEQRQAKARDRGDDGLFSFTTRVRFEVGGEIRDEEVRVRERTHAFELRLEHKPAQVIFDPGDVILKAVKFDKGRSLWKRQLAAGRLGIDRVLAARALGKLPEPASVSALREALASDPFWAARAAAARALGALRRDDALEALIEAASDKHPRVRRAVFAGLGEFRDDARAADTLARRVEAGDPSYFAEAEAAAALGRTRSPRALDVLPAAAARTSFQDVVRARALEGLGATADERAIPLARAVFLPGTPFQGRRAAVAAVARLAEGTTHTRAAREMIETALDDPDFRVRVQGATSLAQLGDGRAVAPIEKALSRELDGRARRALRQAVADLRDGTRPGEQARRVQEEIERLRGETGKLRERLEKLEAKARRDARGKKGTASGAAGGTGGRGRRRSGRRR